MKYKGMKLKEFTSDKPVVFDPPKLMLVWDTDDYDRELDDPVLVYAYIPERKWKAIADPGTWKHCAEIPEEPKPRRATNRELAKWLGQGLGQCMTVQTGSVWTEYVYDNPNDNVPCSPDFMVRKWQDAEWHEPTVDYMGLED